MIAFASFTDFLTMGNHGAYVWSAYGLGLALMALNAILPLLEKRRYLSDLSRRLRRERML